jgi:type IV pilus biogenesis protein PilP
MADNQLKGMLGTNKQKITAIAVVIMVIIVIWQVIGLFGGSSEPTITPAANTQKPMSAAAPGAAPAPGTPNQAAPMAAAVPSGDQQLAPVAALTIHKDSDLLKQQQEEQKAYLDNLNRLQLLKVQREIAETNQAISTAKLATATADKSMSDLLTSPTPPPVPAGAYASKLGGAPGEPPSGAPTEGSQTTSTTTTVKVVEPQYTVISVSMQFAKWTAVLGISGKLFNISVGDSLPDGTVVTSINKSGVTLEKDGQKKKISVLTSI